MNTVEIRPGVALAYEDDWFGPPWTVPQSVVMIHGNAESSRAWFAWVPRLAARYRAFPRRARHREMPSGGRQIRRVGRHRVREPECGPASFAGAVRLAGARERDWQRGPDPPEGRA